MKKILLCLLPLLMTTQTLESNASIVSVVREEYVDLAGSEVAKHGFRPEFTASKDKYGLVEFRVEAPSTLDNRVYAFSHIELFNENENIASYSPSRYSQNDKWYISANINRGVVAKVLVEIYYAKAPRIQDYKIVRFYVDLKKL